MTGGGLEVAQRFLQGADLEVLAHGDEFRRDADRYLFRGLGTYLDSNGREDALEVARIDALSFQGLVQQAGFSPAPQQANVLGRRENGEAEAGEIVIVASGRNQQIGGIVHGKFFEHLFPGFYVDLVGIGKAIAAGVLDPIVYHGHLEANSLDHGSHALADMTCSKDEKSRIGKNGLQVHLHDTSAEQAAFFRVILGQIEAEQLWSLEAHDHKRLAADFGFRAAAADATDLVAVLIDKHLGSVFSRRGAFAHHDRSQSGPAPAAAQLDNLLVNIPGHRTPLCRRHSVSRKGSEEPLRSEAVKKLSLWRGS